jgi:flavin-dependent dehydrogenase
VIARRTDFDGALLDAAVAAGVTHVRERVIDVDAAPDGVTIRTLAGCYHADRVIGADGANSLVRRRVTQPFSRAQLSIATGFFARGASAPAIVVRFETDPPGYLWSFPRPDHLAIGICAPADAVQVAALRSRAAQWIQRANLGQHVTLEPYAWPIPSLGARHWDSEQPAGARWLLVGDAAGLVDPITREGISYALQSAEQAAAAIASSGDSARAYAESVRDTLYPELRLAAALKADFYGQRFLRLMIEALARSGPVRRAMTDLIAGRQQYATLKRRLLATFELALVWRLFRPVPPSRAHHGARPLDLDVDRSPHRRA